MLPTPPPKQNWRKRKREQTLQFRGALDIWKRGEGPHPSTGLWMSGKAAFRFIPCYWCLSPFRDDLEACPECHTARDVNRSLEAATRSHKDYLTIVRENARKAGKDPDTEMRKAKARGQNIIFGWSDNASLLSQLNKYLDRVNPTRIRTGWDFARANIKPRICEICKKVFRPTIVSNQYGGQKVCVACRPEVAKRRSRKQWLKKHPDIKPVGRPKKRAAP